MKKYLWIMTGIIGLCGMESWGDAQRDAATVRTCWENKQLPAIIGQNPFYSVECKKTLTGDEDEFAAVAWAVHRGVHDFSSLQKAFSSEAFPKHNPYGFTFSSLIDLSQVPECKKSEKSEEGEEDNNQGPIMEDTEWMCKNINAGRETGKEEWAAISDSALTEKESKIVIKENQQETKVAKCMTNPVCEQHIDKKKFDIRYRPASQSESAHWERKSAIKNLSTGMHGTRDAQACVLLLAKGRDHQKLPNACYGDSDGTISRDILKALAPPPASSRHSR